MSHLVVVTCTTCDTGASVAVDPAYIHRARCGPCIAAARPPRGELETVTYDPAPGKRVDVPREGFARKEPKPEIAEHVPHPKPEVEARPAEASEVPTGAARWIKKAELYGWRVTPTYARGTSMDARGNPGSLIESIALRMFGPVDGWRAVATWERKVDGGKWTSGLVMAWDPENPFRHVKLTDGRRDKSVGPAPELLADHLVRGRESEDKA